MKLIDILNKLLTEAEVKKLRVTYWRPPGRGPEKWTVADDAGNVYFSGSEKHVQSLIAQISDVGLDKSVELVKNARGSVQTFKLNINKWNEYKNG